MTVQQEAREAANPLERWPDFNEQSWSQRFNELNRRYQELSEQVSTAILAARLDGAKAMREAAEVCRIRIPPGDKEYARHVLRCKSAAIRAIDPEAVIKASAVE